MGKAGRILSEIWGDESFQALTARAQRMYFLLISQPDIEMNGVIALRERRWAKAAADSTTETIWNDLQELREHHFVVVDEDAGEVLVRAYIRRDGVYLQPFPMVAAGRALRSVTSKIILETIATEIDRVVRENTDEVRTKQDLVPLTPSQKTGISTFLQSLKAVAPQIYETVGAPTWEKTGVPQFVRNTNRKGSPKGSEKGLGKGSPKAAGARGKLLTLGSDRRTQASETFPPTAAPLGEPDDGSLPGLPATDPQQPKTRRRGRTIKNDDPQFVRFWDAYPRRVGKGDARKAWAKAIENGADPESVISAAERFAVVRAGKPGEEEFTPYPATWLNREHFDDEPAVTTGRASAEHVPFWEA